MTSPNSQPSSPRAPSPRPSTPPRPPSPPSRVPSRVPSPPSSDTPPGPDPETPSPGGTGRNTPLEDDYPPASRPKILVALDFIRMVKDATLETQFSPEELTEFLDPQEHTSTPSDDPDLKYSLRNFITCMDSSQRTYEEVCQNARERCPEIKPLSYYQVQRRARDLSGIVTWEHHMCANSCIGFTGPFAALEYCPECGQPRYDQQTLEESDGEDKVPRKVFTTFPVGPQLQARWKYPQTAESMFYRWEKTQDLRQEREEFDVPLDVYDDILSGQAYLDAANDAPINEYDTALMFSIDGAQLYRNKKSECWIYIWIILDLGPNKRYKIRNILPGGVIPGPNGPKDLDSFLFPGLAHVSALQREGLPIWDAYNRRRALSFLFLLLVLADVVAMAELSGSVGHHGQKGCRLLCGFAGRNKVHGAHYYPALLRPHGFETHRTSAHPDVNINSLPDPDPEQYRRDLYHVISSRNKTEHGRRRLHTGIGKPSIFDGIPRILSLPTCFAGDLMHQPVINLAALLIDLWCERPDACDQDRHSFWPWAVLTGDAWVKQGKVVAEATKHLPTSFGCPPRNPQEKISSGYKAWEFLNYLYGEGPGVLYDVLPEPYYSHFCKLVRGIRIIHQRCISKDQLITAHQLLLQWCLDFETIYFQRNPDRLHFVRQCVHSITHLSKETHRLGPLSLSSQWTMERVIGYFGSLIRQPSKPNQNLAAQARHVAHINALVCMWPEFDRETRDPSGSMDLGDGYLLLGPKDTDIHQISLTEQMALNDFCSNHPDAENVNRRSVYQWGRLRLPVEQTARSRWKEMERCSNMARTDRNVKVRKLISFRA